MRTDPRRLSLIERRSSLIELVEITQPAAAESGLDLSLIHI